MFKKSIKDNSKFIVPFLQGMKLYGSDEIISNVGTMIILNENGTLLTCNHIATEIINSQILTESYPKLVEQLNNKTNTERKHIEKDKNLSKDTCVLSIINWPFSIKEGSKIEIITHPILDLALIKIEGLKFNLETYPTFSKTLPEQGQSICKLGYAFPNIDIFKYDKDKKSIIPKENGCYELPLFPLDGIITRHISLNLNNNKYNNVMIETSTPGLRGQSGGPIFNPDGLIYGIQSMTSHMDLNFDININVKRGNEIKNISANPLINLGIGISSNEIIKFLENNNIEFNQR